MASLTKPNWRFAARGGGIDYVNDPSSAHFSDAPIAKLVRESIQNALDAKHDGFAGPVTVMFTETSVGADLIGGTTLQRHLQSCFDKIATDRPDMADIYESALSVMRQADVPCLKIQDTGTVGLNDERWKALVLQEGAVSKSGGAPGGSYGIGKNAMLNVSDLQTVFYSTRLVEGRKGLVTKLQGKATLTGHPDPDGSGEDLQHIGFYSARNGEPVMGRDIPGFFRLEETGTGVFVVGFNPHSTGWVDQVTTAVIENFFYAVHNQYLTVGIVPEGQDPVRIDNQTIGYLFERIAPIKGDAVHYYRAISDLPEEEVEITKRFGALGRLRAYIVFTDGAPRRVAHINRNGMLITDSREQRVNPLAPRGRSLWPDFACVIVPDSDPGDLWLRRMENPSHDALSPGHLRNEADRRKSRNLLRRTRRELRSIIDKKAEVDRYGDITNIDELSDLLPDQDSVAGDRPLTTSVIESRSKPSDTVTIVTEESESTGGGEGEDPRDRKGDEERRDDGEGGPKHGEDGDAPIRHRERRTVLRRVRYIPLSPDEAIIAFDPSGDQPQEVRLSLTPAGAERDQRGTRRVAITEATRLGVAEEPIKVTDGQIVFTPDSAERVTVRIVADGCLDQQAFRLA